MHRYTYKEKEKNMKDKIFGVLQRVGRSFMLPIAILPVAGLLLGLGSSFTNATTIATYGLQGILGEGTTSSFAADYYEQGWKCDLR